MVFKPLSCIYGKIIIPQRYVMIIMIHLGALNAYNLRIVLNIAITVMTVQNETTIVNECPEYEYPKSDVQGGKYQWSNEIEAFVLYSFYIGYLISPIIGGWMADKYGARHVLGSCVLISAMITLVFPWAIQHWDYVAAILGRLIIGFAQGPTLPTLSTFIQNWVPQRERGFLGGVAFSGTNLGTVVGSSLSGMMINYYNNWTIPFYVWGACACIWYIFYLFMVFSWPSTHPFITQEECDYLNECIVRKEKFEVPWLKIFSTVPIWAMLLAQLGHNYIFFTVFTDLPKYLKEILKMDVQTNAVVTAIPFLGLWISGILFAFLSDIITEKKWLSIVHTRKLYTSFSIIAPALCIVLAMYLDALSLTVVALSCQDKKVRQAACHVLSKFYFHLEARQTGKDNLLWIRYMEAVCKGCNRKAVVALYIVALILMGPFFAGLKVNANDLTNNYCGIVTAIVNGLGAISGIAAPYVVGAVTTNHTLNEWQNVSWILLAFSVFTAIMYIIFGRAQRQKWDYLETEDIPA